MISSCIAGGPFETPVHMNEYQCLKIVVIWFALVALFMNHWCDTFSTTKEDDYSKYSR